MGTKEGGTLITSEGPEGQAFCTCRFSFTGSYSKPLRVIIYTIHLL